MGGEDVGGHGQMCGSVGRERRRERERERDPHNLAPKYPLSHQRALALTWESCPHECLGMYWLVKDEALIFGQ